MVVLMNRFWKSLDFDLCRNKASKLVSRINGVDEYSRAIQAHNFSARNVSYKSGIDIDLYTIVGPFTKK